MKLAIIDIIGIPYDGDTVDNQGLGGSESAVTLMSRELNNIGFSVTVFNNCGIDHARSGNFNGVEYQPLSDLALDHEFDIVISSRTIIPFTKPEDYHRLGDGRAMPFQSMNLYDRIVSQAKMRILWMHDTFCLGDNLIEELAIANRITDIFTLSDFHLTYVANCNHGRRRNFEVLKRKLFITRNGAQNFKTEVDINAKDPNLFVYNASVTKGMVPLIQQIWPRVKAHIPSARLKVIGGYYRFSESSEPDQQEKDWRIMSVDPRNQELGIEYTGVISQKEIASILTESSFMIYPSVFPETFGISSLESLLYNTPIITCRFGALEEIALEGACYLMDYAVEPNVLFPDINTTEQIDKFVNLTIQAYHNRYLHQQKQYYCNIIKDIAGWDSVALQWKQFMVHKLGNYLPRDEYRVVSKINHRVHKVWSRRFTNTIELENYKSGNEQSIAIISPFFNCANYISRCIISVASQDYDNYQHILIDDASTDNSIEVILATLKVLPEDIRNKVTVISNHENLGAVRNQIQNIRTLIGDDSIVMLLDGDDSLINDNTVLSYYNSIYDGTTEFTYGSCWSMVDDIPLISQPYPEDVKQRKDYRNHHFNWILPYTHLRTFKKSLLNTINDDQFKDSNDNWYKAGGDGSVFYALIEAADPNKVKCITDVVYNYNDASPLNDYKVNGLEQNRNAKEIVNKMNHTKKKILIAIPTAKNIEPDTFKSIYDLTVPDGYETTFQYFFGYNVDQVRNLIADWVVNGFDYLFSVDSDIAFAPDTLSKMLAHDRDVVSGLYIQRKPGQHILEIYEHTATGGVVNMPYGKLKGRTLVEVAGCGFGCALVKAEVMRKIGYPQFKYYSAISINDTISEDVDFCRKARDNGFTIWADPTILCRHTGSFTFNVDIATPVINTTSEVVDIKQFLRELRDPYPFPPDHIEYLNKLKNEGIDPLVIYDIGACVLHWTDRVRKIWPNAKVIAFEAADVHEFLYQETGIQYHIGVLSDESGKEVNFYQNDEAPGGNSYYRENAEIQPAAATLYSDRYLRKLRTITLDAVANLKQFPPPDLIKMDVQGAELDVLKGAQETIKTAKHIILELQIVEYNKGAPLKDTVIAYMDSIGYDCLGLFSNNGPDGDYHFVRR
jgi:FkbM family methyltransferase